MYKKYPFLFIGAFLLSSNLNSSISSYLPTTKRGKTFIFLGTVLGMGTVYLVLLCKGYFSGKKITKSPDKLANEEVAKEEQNKVILDTLDSKKCMRMNACSSNINFITSNVDTIKVLSV